VQIAPKLEQDPLWFVLAPVYLTSLNVKGYYFISLGYHFHLSLVVADKMPFCTWEKTLINNGKLSSIINLDEGITLDDWMGFIEYRVECDSLR
jgi:hypothetical protein